MKLFQSANDIFDSNIVNDYDYEENKNEIFDNLYQLIKKLKVTETVLISAFILIDRAISNNPKLVDIRKLQLVCSIAVILAQKFLDDEVYDDECYAEALNIEISEFIQVESHFLKYIQFKLFISEKELISYCEFII